MTGITEQLADFCAGLRTHVVPEPILDHAAAADILAAYLAQAGYEEMPRRS